MTYRDKGLQAELVARRVAARRRVTTESDSTAASPMSWWLTAGGLAALALACLSLV